MSKTVTLSTASSRMSLVPLVTPVASTVMPAMMHTTMNVLVFQVRLLVSRLFCAGRSVAWAVMRRLLFIALLLALEILLSDRDVFANLEGTPVPPDIPLTTSVYMDDSPEPMFFAIDKSVAWRGGGCNGVVWRCDETMLCARAPCPRNHDVAWLAGAIPDDECEVIPVSLDVPHYSDRLSQCTQSAILTRTWRSVATSPT